MVVSDIPAVEKAPSTTLVHIMPMTMPKAVPSEVAMVFRNSATVTFFSPILPLTSIQPQIIAVAYQRLLKTCRTSEYHFIAATSLVTARERRIASLASDTVVVSLDIVARILENPDWSKKARKVKTLKEMRQIILDFCEANGTVVRTDEETFCT